MTEGLHFDGDVRTGGIRDPSLALRMTMGRRGMTIGEARMIIGDRMTL